MSIKTYALNNHVPIIKDEGLNLLLATIKENKAKAILELGNATFELQAGEELTMEEINELAESTENPETNDTTIWQLTIMTFMVALIGYFVRKVAMDD